MKRKRQIYLLTPAAVSLTCFIAAFIWMAIAGTNRSSVDLSLALVGYLAFAVALITSIAGAVIAFRDGGQQMWPWLVAQVTALGTALCLAFVWLGAHLA